MWKSITEPVYEGCPPPYGIPGAFIERKDNKLLFISYKFISAMKEKPSFRNFYWKGFWNKAVVVIPIIIGILSLVSIYHLPEYKAASLLATAFTVFVSGMNILLTYHAWKNS